MIYFSLAFYIIICSPKCVCWLGSYCGLIHWVNFIEITEKLCFPRVTPHIHVFSCFHLWLVMTCVHCCNVNAFLVSPFQLVSNANLELENIRSDLKSKQLELEQATYSVTNLKVCMTSPRLVWHHVSLYEIIRVVSLSL